MMRYTGFALSLVFSVAGSQLALANSFSYGTRDTNAQGAYGVNPDGSIHLQTFDNSGKADVIFFAGPTYTGASLGNLGDITKFAGDYYKSSSPATPSNANLAFRLFTNQGLTEGLVWENAYQSGNQAVPLDSWQHADFTGGLFWERANHLNFQNASDAHTLADFAGGVTPTGGKTLSPTSAIYGVQVSYGTGAGVFDGSVANVELDFGSTTYLGAPQSPAVTPLPSGALGGMALLGITAAFGIVRSNRKALA